MRLVVRHRKNAAEAFSGEVVLGGKKYLCALGRSGIKIKRKEGDGVTPLGRYEILKSFYRPDKFDEPPKSGLPFTPLTPACGWCDDPGDPHYNREILFPFSASAEKLWRDDDLYDVILVLSYNSAPVTAGLGSAIFIHLATEDFSPTAGCVALSRHDMLELLERLDESVEVWVEG